MKQLYKLVNGEHMNKKYPTTFHIPSAKEKAALNVGDIVKLGFIGPGHEMDEQLVPNHENMWVKLTGEGVGVLDSDPVFLPLVRGQEVRFKPHHILSYITNGKEWATAQFQP
jgi:hypothetical protein